MVKKVSKKATKKKAVSKKLTTPATSKKQIEYKMNAYVIFGMKSDARVKLPSTFLTTLIGLPVDQRWDNDQPKDGSICKNIINLGLSSEKMFGPDQVYNASLVEVTFKDKMDLMGFDGVDKAFQLPQSKGPRQIWNLRYAPHYDLIVIESGVGIENKLHQYLNFFLINQFNKKVVKPEDSLDSIGIAAIPVESDPVTFLRTNPNVGSFQAVINANAFNKQAYGPLGDVLTGLDPREEKLVLEITLRTQKRGAGLPEILTTNLADFLEGIGSTDLTQARAREIDDGKKMRPTKLLGALHHKIKFVDDDDKTKTNELNSYINSLMIDIGDDIKIKDN